MEWKHDIINWPKISNETAALMLNQSETVLKETVETSKAISVRADKLISMLLPIATGLIVFILNTGVAKILCFLPLTSILSLIVIFVSLFFAYKNFEKYNVSIPGEYPKDIVSSMFIDNDYDGHEQYVNMIISVCQNIENRIAINEIANTKRMGNNIKSLRSLFALLVCPILSYLLSYLYH